MLVVGRADVHGVRISARGTAIVLDFEFDFVKAGYCIGHSDCWVDEPIRPEVASARDVPPIADNAPVIIVAA